MEVQVDQGPTRSQKHQQETDSNGKMSRVKTILLVGCLVVTTAGASASVAMFTKVMNNEKLQTELNKLSTNFTITIEKVKTMIINVEELNKKSQQDMIHDFNHSLFLLESKLNAAKEDIDGRLTLLSRPENCSVSNEDGRQLLSSGENVYCHKHWRVIQRRFNGQVIFHNKTWNEYKNGFGNLSTEFWIGLDKMYNLTRNGGCKLRVELGAFDGSEAYAEYRQFSIGSESDLFRLNISGYSGNGGDSIMDRGHPNNNMAFTTVDTDNDKWQEGNCALYGAGAWWWNYCGYARLNGRREENLNTFESFTWYQWKQAWITLKSSMMMIRCD